MKTRIVLSIIAVLLMQFTTVSADNYTDGLAKLMNNEAVANCDINVFEQLAKAVGVDADYVKGSFKTDAIDWLAEHYRENMSEKNFEDMLSFFMQPDVLSAQKKVISAVSAAREDKKVKEQLAQKMVILLFGGTPDPLKEPNCDPRLKKELLRWMENNSSVEALTAMCKDVGDVSVKQKYPNASDNEKIMLSPEVTGLLSYMGDNATALLLMAMVEKVGLKDLQTLNAIENKPFFESYKKANLSLANDLPTIMAKLLAGKKEEINSESKN